MHHIGIANRNHKSRWQLEAHGGHAREFLAAATKGNWGESWTPRLIQPQGRDEWEKSRDGFQVLCLVGSLKRGWDSSMVLETMFGWCGPFAAMAIDDWEEKAACMRHLASRAQIQTSNTNFVMRPTKLRRCSLCWP
jgi:hypothetical protein